MNDAPGMSSLYLERVTAPVEKVVCRLLAVKHISDVTVNATFAVKIKYGGWMEITVEWNTSQENGDHWFFFAVVGSLDVSLSAPTKLILLKRGLDIVEAESVVPTIIFIRRTMEALRAAQAGRSVDA